VDGWDLGGLLPGLRGCSFGPDDRREAAQSQGHQHAEYGSDCIRRSIPSARPGSGSGRGRSMLAAGRRCAVN